MGTETFVNYWIGQEPNPPSPLLDAMPPYVNIAPLAFVTISSSYTLDFTFLTQHFSAAQIQDWIATVQGNGTKVLLSINDSKLGSIPANQFDAFVQNVADDVAAWGVDGLDFDFEPPYEPSGTLVPVVQALRGALPTGSVFTAPIYGAWLGGEETLLAQFAAELDLVTTMDYTPYPGYDATISLCNQYANIIGGWSKLAIGISCMGPSDGSNFTPLADAATLSAYQPSSGSKGGAMLYTFSYDVTTRNNGTSGTGYPDGTWTQTINENLP